MTSLETEKLKTAQEVHYLLKMNPDKTAKAKAVLSDMDALKTAIESALDAEKNATQPSSYTTKDTKQSRKALIENVSTVAGITYSYAARVDNKTLMDKMDVTEAKLSRISPVTLPTQCKTIIAEIRLHLAEMTALEYTISEADIVSIDNLIAAFSDKAPKVSNVKSFKKTNTAARRTYITDVMSILKQRVLKTALAFKKTDLDFYNQLIHAATLDKVYVSPTMLKFVVSNSKTKELMPNHSFTVPELNMELTTDENGIVMVKIGRDQVKNMSKNRLIMGNPLAKGIKPAKGKTMTVEIEVG